MVMQKRFQVGASVLLSHPCFTCASCLQEEGAVDLEVFPPSIALAALAAEVKDTTKQQHAPSVAALSQTVSQLALPQVALPLADACGTMSLPNGAAVPPEVCLTVAKRLRTHMAAFARAVHGEGGTAAMHDGDSSIARAASAHKSDIQLSCSPIAIR